jgi:hypothetical protein
MTGLYGRRKRRRGALCNNSYLFYLVDYSVCIICKGDPYPENGAQRRLGAEDFICLGFARRGGGRFPLSLSTYLFGVNGRINENKTNINKDAFALGVLLGKSSELTPLLFST